MKIAVDTPVLVRAVVRDDSVPASIAIRILTDTELIAVATPCLCEVVWVLLRVYEFQSTEVASAIRALLATANVEVDRPAIEAGLSLLEAGGDFADGAIAHEGYWLGGETFVSFDSGSTPHGTRSIRATLVSPPQEKSPPKRARLPCEEGLT